MGRRDFLGEFEQLVLLAVLRLEEQAYGMTILDEIAETADRPVSRGSVYITLDRLEKKGYLSSELADPTPERGGRAKRYYRLEAAGLTALRASRRTLQKMWDGLEPLLGET